MTTLGLKNIGAIRSAEMNIGGLTVIAGENNSGKSTVGKALMALIKANNDGQDEQSRKKSFFKFNDLLFDGGICGSGEDDADIALKTDTQEISIAIIQMLLDNNYLTPRGFFIFDEPENHLHPLWQYIRRNRGVYIMINTHSPDMLKTFNLKINEQEHEGNKLKVNFYLAKDNVICQIEGDNRKTLQEALDTLTVHLCSVWDTLYKPRF